MANDEMRDVRRVHLAVAALRLHRPAQWTVAAVAHRLREEVLT